VVRPGRGHGAVRDREASALRVRGLLAGEELPSAVVSPFSLCLCVRQGIGLSVRAARA